MTRTPWLVSGVAALAILWIGPLPELAAHRFSAHMTMHMGVVAVAAPLVAMGLARSAVDLVSRRPWLFNAIAASVVELLVVWAWHVPALHRAARTSVAALLLEQGMFFGSGLLVWLSALAGGHKHEAHQRAAAGVVALLLTSMHMTLLGALLALAPRVIYTHAGADGAAPGALADQHLGGAIMLLVGGIAYLAGGLGLSARLLRHTHHVARRGLA